jgi:hypothetical protein
MTEPAADVGRAAHLPEQPVQRFGALVGIGRQEGAEFLREIEQDRSGLEHAARLGTAAIHESRYLRVRVDIHKAAAELLALADVDQPGIVLGAAVAECKQLLQHHGHLHAVGRSTRIELQGCLPTGSFASCVGPAMGRLTPEYLHSSPARGFSHFQIFGGV